MSGRVHGLGLHLRDADGRVRIRWRNVVLVGFIAIVIALLFDRAGLAIVIGSLVVPVAIVVEVRRLDSTPDEPRWGMPIAMVWGWAVGVVAGGLATFTVDQLWFDAHGINAGAVGFGGAAAQAAGPPPFTVIFLDGIGLTLFAAIATFAGPFGIRRAARFRDELLDGVGVGGAAGSSFAAGTALVGFWRLFSDMPLDASVSVWTALLIGALVTRPLIYGLAMAIACAGIWRATIAGRQDIATLPVFAAIAGLIVFVLGDLVTQARGPRLELSWHLVALIGLWVLFRASTRDAIQQRALVHAMGDLVRCPSCGRLTAAGGFCSACGTALKARALPAGSVQVELVDGESEAGAGATDSMDVTESREVSSR